MTTLVPTTFYFRFSFSVGYRADMPAAAARPGPRSSTGPTDTFEFLALAAADCLPSLASLDGRTDFAQLRLAWNERGLGISLAVIGKHRPPQIDAHRPELSDALHVWIDTRDARTIHRATRFCHHFYFLPTLEWPREGRARHPQPTPAPAGQLKINRAREDAPFCRPSDLLAFVVPIVATSPLPDNTADQPDAPASASRRIASSRRARETHRQSNEPVARTTARRPTTTHHSPLTPLACGYLLEAFLPAQVLTGFDPQENPRLGFYYHVHDAELGDQFLTVGRDFPFAEDPSLWATLELARH